MGPVPEIEGGRRQRRVLNAEQKKRAKDADLRRKARMKAAKLGLEGPPLLRVMRHKRAHAQTPEEKAQRAAERSAALRESSAAYRRRNPEKRKQTQAAYRARNRDAIAERARSHPNATARRRAYKERRLAEDPQFKIRTYLSKRMVCAIRRGGARKSDRTVALLGCSIPKLKSHIEAMFVVGMSWENWGDWHIDHIRPCASYDLSDPREQLACFHFTNLRPMWAKDNIRKGAKITLLV